ncbi:MAG: hypothetical protein L0L17_01480 [Yaniella sp.]|uniref:hypothetical protein n=1 Tax=Yaniella sp. TaxID=2773929 RepID=UPI002648BAB8|nr:hypothetical protein [Yaniella sp.]MDN5705076.1 hypothetical protein [Yaniella sp.]MDN5818877.1 hypothetical protein [Yaniella sp.]MDN5888929.1 hypothetical protein [Yaniella sp.]MDN5913351.1 hypothetical protein [Yaniella sp.]MDN6150166.1 hypothetical protein [Yaniella sp.]
MSARPRKFKTVTADDSVRRGRIAKAEQFLQVADDARELAVADLEVADAAVTLYVHAGIAASDAICVQRLGKHSKGQDHQDAVALLATVDSDASIYLNNLLAMKTRAGYGHDPISLTNLVRAERAARALMRMVQE